MSDTCKWCNLPPAAGDNVCEGHRRLNASMSSKPAETSAVDDDERKRLCDKINEWKRRYFLVADAVARESESAEQLADIARQTRADLATANEEIAQLREACLQHVHVDVHAATKARLGRACDLIRRQVAAIEGDWCTSPTVEEMNAILTDAESAQAGEAWRELEAVYEAAKRNRERHRWQDYAILDKALAAVDARRGAK